MIAKGIAWTTDRNVKFQNPANMNFNNTMMPKNWQIPVNQLGNGDQTNVYHRAIIHLLFVIVIISYFFFL